MGITRSIVNPTVKKVVNQVVGFPFNFSPSDISRTEADALIAFYDATSGDDWTDNTGWKTDREMGNWYGVTVSGGYVTALALPANGLSTTAAAIAALDLSALPYLAEVDLSDNGFSEAVVDAWLERLDASGIINAVIDLSGNNEIPSAAGETSIASLEGKGCTITVTALAYGVIWYGPDASVELRDTYQIGVIRNGEFSEEVVASFPVQESMARVLRKADGSSKKYLKSDDSTKLADGSAATLDGTDGDVQVEVSKHYQLWHKIGAARYIFV